MKEINRFILEIEFGKNEIHTPSDVATALRRAANQLDHTPNEEQHKFTVIKDECGNICGHYDYLNRGK